MIVQWFFDLYATAQGWMTSAFPQDWTVPQQVLDLDTTINSVTSQLGNVGVWVDWPLVIVCVSASVLAWVIASTIKLIRAVASYLPFIGGAG